MTWLVTGGAGYIGAHVLRAFRDAGIGTVCLDDLSSGHSVFVPADIPFVEASILDRAAVQGALEQHGVTGVVHVAGFKYAGVSVQRPLHTYDQNVTGTVSVLQAMQDTGVDKMVFSSSAATFGTPELAGHVRAALEGRQVALMGNHGSVAVGADLDHAVEHAVLLEWLAALHHRTSALGTPRVLTDREQEDVVLAALSRSYGRKEPS